MKKILTVNFATWVLLQSIGFCTLYAVSSAMLSGVAVAQVSPARDLLDREVSIDMKNTKLSDILVELEEKARVKFEYSPDRLRISEIVSVTAKNKKLREVLAELLAPLGIMFTANEQYNYILLKPASAKRNDRAESTTQGSAIRVTGRVNDSQTNEPLPGVSVIVKGTSNGVATNADGTYSIEATISDLLIFSFISYKSLELEVTEQSIINVSLNSEVSTLNEVVINAGYYDVKDREKTGSISKVSSDVIEKQPVTNVLSALQGQTPGVYIEQYSGAPGGNFTVRIRGTNSLSNGNNPLYIIDGVPFISNPMSDSYTTGSLYLTGTSPMNSINPADIESIEILRDADATAIYGSRGANGVVLITTKRGKAGALKTDISFRSGISKVTQFMDMMDTKEYLAMRMEAVNNDGNGIQPYEFDINGTWDKERNTNWQKVLIGSTASMNDLNASLSGGSQQTQFLFGAGFNNQTTVFSGNNSADRFSTHFAVTHTSLDKRFNTRLSTSYVLNTSDIVNRDLTDYATSLAPNAPKLHDENGNTNWENSTFLANPISQLGRRYQSNVSNLLTSIELGYEIFKNVKLKTSIGLNDIRNNDRGVFPSNLNVQSPITQPSPAKSQLAMADASDRSFIIEPQLNWNGQLGKGRLAVLVGATYQDKLSESKREIYAGFASNTLINNPRAASNFRLDSYNYAEYKYAAIYGRLNYIWDEKYIVNLTGRRDGSSRFGPGKKFANLGAVGSAWVFSNEQLVKDNLTFLSFGKLRASYGLTGNDQIGDYKYLDTYNAGTSYQGIPALTPAQLFNPDYGWEVNKKIEGAVDLGFLSDRILLTVAYYRNRSSNQLINYALAGTSGFASILKNFEATVQNTGVEIELNTVNISKSAFIWSTSFNVTFPKNKLVAFPNLESSSYSNTYVLGKSLTLYKSYHYKGIDPVTGLYQFADMNDDEQITTDDKQSFRELKQLMFGGVQNSITFYGLQVDVLFQFVRQVGSRFDSYRIPGEFGSGQGNQPKAIYNEQWQEVDDNAARQLFSRSSVAINQYERYLESDGRVQTISFVRLKNVSISYEIPKKLLNTIKARVYAQGQNLFKITNYKGLDPETGSRVLPPLTTLVIGLNLMI